MQQETESEEMMFADDYAVDAGGAAIMATALGASASSSILSIVTEACGGVAFYATDPSTFWMAAEDSASFPCVGIYEVQGVANWDAMGVIYPRLELHFITQGGAFDERTDASADLATLRAFLRATLHNLRPYIRGGIGTPNFARKDSLYSLWVSVDFRDPYSYCL